MSKKASKNQRELKVYTKYTTAKFRKAEIVPEIRLKGKWLKTWGYGTGDSICIKRIGDNILILNKIANVPIIRL